jgi:hypothetical protein
VTTKLEAALAYAGWGWPVLPLKPNLKTPATDHGVHDATTDPEQIRKWWTQDPERNIGVAAGRVSKLTVFDVDPRNGGDGSWDEWIGEVGAVEGAMQLTAGGGQHYLAAYDPDISSGKLAQGVDLLSDGRYFLVFPSVIDGKKYEWEASSDPFEGVAPFVINEAWKEGYSRRRGKKSGQTQLPDQISEGGRNDGLTSVGGHLRGIGFSESVIHAALCALNQERCSPPLDETEVAGIAKSVFRYPPNSDLVASAALGAEAARNLLRNSGGVTSEERFLVPADELTAQPAPLPWLIKGLVPDKGLTMVFGESGSGKTFITLDIACHIAAGLPWMGRKVRQGAAIYCAGEGLYGLRQRYAAWRAMYPSDSPYPAFVSMRAIDVDAPTSADYLIEHVRSCTDQPAALVVIDTLNNHMSGDENSAQHTRNMVRSCNQIAEALGAAVILNHHTGHGEDTKGRARGSSAWKASLDASFFVSKTSKGLIKVSCTKMKDAPLPEDFYGELRPQEINWVDDEGIKISSAVFVQGEAPESSAEEASPKKPNKYQEHMKTLERAWWQSGAGVVDGHPLISRKALQDLLIKDGMTEKTAKNNLSPGARNKLIGFLLNADAIEPFEEGWRVLDTVEASAWLVRRGSKHDSEYRSWGAAEVAPEPSDPQSPTPLYEKGVGTGDAGTGEDLSSSVKEVCKENQGEDDGEHL